MSEIIEPMNGQFPEGFSPKPYAVVVGGVNIDIGGRSYKPLIAKDSNPGKVTVSLGGVGRNIAHNLSLMGPKVRFLTAFGDDLYAQKVLASCAQLGIDITHALQIEGASTSTYVFLNDADGDMALAISDMDICDQLTPEYLASNLSLLQGAKVIVADTNIPVESLEYLVDHCQVPVFIDPVSTAKAMKLTSLLGKIHTLKPNLLEAELLTGVKVVDDTTLEEAAQLLLDTGLQRVFISLGADGVFAADHQRMIRVPCVETAMRNATGAGDSFMAALAWSFMEEQDLYESARRATAAASLAIEAETTINDDMSAEAILARLK